MLTIEYTNLHYLNRISQNKANLKYTGTSSSIRTKLWWNSHWIVLFQNCVWQSRSPTKTDTILEEDHPMAILSKFGSNWAAHRFQTRRFVCEFPIGSYVKLSSAVGAIMVEGPNRRTQFWKITIQWLFHQNFVLIEQDGIKKKSSPLKLLSQSQPNFDKIAIGWSSSKIVSGGLALWPRWLHSCT
jgi:hypothetical protein